MSESNVYQTPIAELDDGLTDEYQPKIFAFSGRVGRLRYVAYSAMYSLIGFTVMGVLAAIFGAVFSNGGAGMAIMMIIVAAGYIGILTGTFTLVVRRLNDLGHAGWFSLLLLVPLINLLMGLYLLFAPGQAEANQYGPKPCKNHGALWIALIAPFVFGGMLASIALPAYYDYVKRAQQSQFDK